MSSSSFLSNQPVFHFHRPKTPDQPVCPVPVIRLMNANHDGDNKKQLPFWALVSFGAWVLFRLGWGMLTFRDTPEAYKELMEEIKIAQADLRAKGVSVD